MAERFTLRTSTRFRTPHFAFPTQMILPLRQKHRWIVCTLAVVLPAAFVFGVAARRTIPLVKPVDINLGIEPHAYGTIVWSDPNGWPGKRISTSLWTDPLGSLAVEFMFDELAGPDVLVYWLSGNRSRQIGYPRTLNSSVHFQIARGSRSPANHKVNSDGSCSTAWPTTR